MQISVPCLAVHCESVIIIHLAKLAELVNRTDVFVDLSGVNENMSFLYLVVYMLNLTATCAT